MEELINIDSFPIRTTLNILLKDKTTKKNIIWATGGYKEFGEEYSDDRQITMIALLGLNPVLIQPRILKAMNMQQERTKSHAEVFTPSWICNKMNNYCDDEWFGRKDVFNMQKEKTWEIVKEKIEFPENKSWMDYVDSRRLEITCGEAPYIVSRYDASTGEVIPIKDRIGLLDRKLRVVCENTDNESEWYKWVIRAFQSVYGYEYQGDNLLICRINLLMTFVEYLAYKWKREAKVTELKKIANIISWNFWQMDGLNDTVPIGEPIDENKQLSFFDMVDAEAETIEQKNNSPKCKIYDWRGDRAILFASMKR